MANSIISGLCLVGLWPLCRQKTIRVGVIKVIYEKTYSTTETHKLMPTLFNLNFKMQKHQLALIEELEACVIHCVYNSEI